MGFSLSTVAEQMLALLGELGVEHFFLNPGTDSAPLQEAMRTLPAAGVRVPAVHGSTFESVSLAAAHGYYQATGRPQCLFVHVDAGTQNLGAIMHDLYRDRAGVIVIAGRTPYGEDASDRGGRSGYIQWLQDVPDQPGVVRPYTKAIIDIARPEMVARAIARAVQLATSYPAGPVYLTVSRDILMDPPSEPARTPPILAVPSPAALSRDSLDEIAALLAGAQAPLLITSRLGRRDEGFYATTELAELLGMPVIRGADCGPVSIATLHPLHPRDLERRAALVREADVILIAECDVPWIPRVLRPDPHCTVVHIDPDPLKATMPMWTFPIHRSAQADGPTAIRQLVETLATVGARDPARKATWEARARSAVADAVPEPPLARRAELSAADVFAALNEVLLDDDVLVEEAVTNSELFYRSVVRRAPGTVHGAFAPGLGWPLGGAIGVKLAKPDRRVVAVCGDGSLLFSVPTSAFMLAAEIGAPFLVVVLDNGGYRASRLPVYELFPEGVSASEHDATGTRFSAAPDFAALAAACGAFGERVECYDELIVALQRGLKAVESGTVALIDVVISQN